MGYGFCLADNPCDYYNVKLGIPPNSPLSWAKRVQVELKKRSPDFDHEKFAEKAAASSYILHFNHPLRRQDGLEYSVFSPDLLENMSILSANDRELERLTISADRCLIDVKTNRCLLNTLSQLAFELPARLSTLKNAAPKAAPVNSKQTTAKTYRQGLIGIIETAIAIVQVCLLRASAKRPSKHPPMPPNMHPSRRPSDDDDDADDELDDYLIQSRTSRLPSVVRHRVDKALLFEGNATNPRELFTSADLSWLLPRSIGAPFMNLGLELERCCEKAGKPFRSGVEGNFVELTLFLCCISRLFKSGLLGDPAEDEAHSTEREDETLERARLEQWVNDLLKAYPEDAGQSYEEETDAAQELLLDVVELYHNDGKGGSASTNQSSVIDPRLAQVAGPSFPPTNIMPSMSTNIPAHIQSSPLIGLYVFLTNKTG